MSMAGTTKLLWWGSKWALLGGMSTRESSKIVFQFGLHKGLKLRATCKTFNANSTEQHCHPSEHAASLVELLVVIKKTFFLHRCSLLLLLLLSTSARQRELKTGSGYHMYTPDSVIRKQVLELSPGFLSV